MNNGPLGSYRRFNKVLASMSAVVMALTGFYVVAATHAATDELYLSPANASVAIGQTVQVAVRVDTDGEAVNAVQANLSYNPAQLEYDGMSSTGTAFPLEAATSGGNGSIQVARAINGGGSPVTGDVLLETLTFKALVGSGNAAITFANGSAVLRASDSSNIIVATGSATFALTGTSTSTPTPTPTTAPTQTPVSGNGTFYLSPASGSSQTGNTFQVAVRVNAGTEQINAVQANLTYDAAKLQYVSMSSTGTAFALEAATSGGSGVVSIARATNGGSAPATGDVLIETVTFKTLATGTAMIGWGTGSAALRASDSTDIIKTKTGSTYALSSGASTPTATPVPTHTPTPTPTATPTRTPTPTPTPTPAGPDGRLYLDPSSGSVTEGAELQLSVRMSSSALVNAVQANLSYPKDKLEFESIASTGSAFSIEAPSSGGNGIVSIARATSGGSNGVNGDALIATVTFKALASSGTATVSWADGTMLLRASDSADNLQSRNNGTYSLIAPAPTITPSAPPSTPPTDGGGEKTPPIIWLPVPGGSVAPVAATGKVTVHTTGTNNAASYTLDGNPITSNELDTTYLDNGTHTITATTTDPSGKKVTVTQPIAVNNQLSTIQKTRNTIVDAFTGHNAVALGGIVLFCLLGVGLIVYLLVLPRIRQSAQMSHMMAQTTPDSQPASSTGVIYPSDSDDKTSGQ